MLFIIGESLNYKPEILCMWEISLSNLITERWDFKDSSYKEKAEITAFYGNKIKLSNDMILNFDFKFSFLYSNIHF